MLDKLTKYFSYNREKYENILDDENSKIGVICEKIITSLVIAFILVLIFESIGDNRFLYTNEIFLFEAFISSVFAIEYIYRFLRSKNKLDFLTNPIRFIDLLSFLPFFIGLIFIGEFVRTLKYIRVLRILRLIRKIPLTRSFIKSLKDFSTEYKAVFMLFFVILFLGSTLVYYAEKDMALTRFTSIPISLWWGLVTMTTVGFGDMYPLTPFGRMLGSVLVFFGPILIALLGAVTIMVFTETNNNQKMLQISKRGKICTRCRTRNYKEANYCYKCGQKLM